MYLNKTTRIGQFAYGATSAAMSVRYFMREGLMVGVFRLTPSTGRCADITRGRDCRVTRCLILAAAPISTQVLVSLSSCSTV